MIHETLETIDGRPALRFECTVATRSSACGGPSACRRSSSAGFPQPPTGRRRQVIPAGHPDPLSLPTIDWNERTSAETEDWCAQQPWLSAGDIRVEDDGVAMSMVGHGLGTTIVPRLSLRGAPPKVAMRPLGPDAPAVSDMSSPPRRSARQPSAR
ncbi:hypothetical protein [Sinosporangium siamense]|uniref:LysR substrate binding domain-containing protein n=1 Tax=Sinosporangium siamense TaxID=1367973 RepID=A0A919RPA8_9ACTN|nr:hypothetical protein [Sinosporangium siamense]GII96149.1 hypothetical protein Ssi02_63800 [Sinosporangium siamense]